MVTDMPLRRTCLASGLVCLSWLLTACAGDDKAGPQQLAVNSSHPSDSDYAARPAPLLTPSASDPSSTARSPKDLPPLVAQIPASMPSRIDVTVRDPLPVSMASLIDPQGHAIAAERIDRNRLSYSGGPAGWPRIGVGIAGGSSSGVSTGFGIGFPLFPQTTEAAGSINESRFSFAIPDIAAYNTNWQRWKIHVDLSDGVNSRSFESLPPPPPPG